MVSDYKCRKCSQNFADFSDGCKLCYKAREAFVVDEDAEASPTSLFRQNISFLRNSLLTLDKRRKELLKNGAPIDAELFKLHRGVSQEITKAASEARQMERAISNKVQSLSAKERQEIIESFLMDMPFSAASDIVKGFYKNLPESQRTLLLSILTTPTKAAASASTAKKNEDSPGN